MRFVTMDGGCIVPISHKLNQDGYLRKTWGNARTHDRIAEMFHRFIFRAHKGLEEIPAGHEIDHTCNNRACCNPEHLRLMTRLDHLIHTNKNRWLLRAAPLT